MLLIIATTVSVVIARTIPASLKALGRVRNPVPWGNEIDRKSVLATDLKQGRMSGGHSP